MSDFSISKHLDLLWRYSLAHSLTLFLLVLAVVSFSVPYADQIKPYFLLMVVYYWAIYRPTMIPSYFLLIVGLLFDLLSGQSFIGITSLIFLIVQWVISDQRLFLMAQPFVVIWLIFSVTCLGGVVLQWFIFSVLSFQLVSVVPIFLQFLITVLLFPIFSFIFNVVNKVLPIHSTTLS